MNYDNLIRRFNFPEDFVAPSELVHDDIVASPLTRSDLQDDMNAVNSSLEIIRSTRGGSWPSEPVSEEFDLLDLAWHEREFRDGDSFAYVVYDTGGNYVGCFYLYPMGFRTPLTDELLNYDIDVSWWVTAKHYERGYYSKLYDALQVWMKQFPVSKVYYSNKEIPNEG